MDDKSILYEFLPNGIEVHRISPDFKHFDERCGLTILAGSRKQIGKPRPFRYIPRYFEFYSISHLLDGAGIYWDAKTNKITPIHQGQVVIVTPGTLHRYGGDKTKYIESFLLFTGPLADYLCEKGIISNVIWEMGRVPRLNKVIELALEPSITSQIQATVTLQQILLDLYNTNCRLRAEKEHPLLIQLLEEIKHIPERWWTVKEMAKYCRMSEGHFRKVFRQYTGETPKRYVEQNKIRKAAELLCSSNLTIREIANRFAYRDPYHFSRRFKQITSFSPDHYRNSFKLHISIDREQKHAK